MPEPSGLSRRERQIMDAVFSLGEATVNQVVETIPSPPTAMAVRRMMHILEEKGYLRRRKSGREVIYVPRQARDKAGRRAFQQVLETFFGGMPALSNYRDGIAFAILILILLFRPAGLLGKMQMEKV